MKNSASELVVGLYDSVLTDSYQKRLEQIDADQLAIEKLDIAPSHQHLADLVKQQLALVLQDLEGNDDEKLLSQLALINHLLTQLRQYLPKNSELIDVVTKPASLLKAIHAKDRNYSTPELGLAQPWLFTAGKDVTALLHELRHELVN